MCIVMLFIIIISSSSSSGSSSSSIMNISIVISMNISSNIDMIMIIMFIMIMMWLLQVGIVTVARSMSVDRGSLPPVLEQKRGLFPRERNGGDASVSHLRFSKHGGSHLRPSGQSARVRISGRGIQGLSSNWRGNGSPQKSELARVELSNYICIHMCVIRCIYIYIYIISYHIISYQIV